MKAIYGLGKLRGSQLMVGQSPAVRIVWCMLLLGLAAISCVSCDAENRQGQPDASERAEQQPESLDSEPASPSPLVPPVEAQDARLQKKTEKPMSDAIDGKATIIAIEGSSYTVSFVLTNTTSEVTVIELGPQVGRLPDGNEIILSQPGVLMAVFQDGEWGTVDERMNLGVNWKRIIRIQPGEQFTWTVEFGVTERGEALLKAGAPAALILHGYGGPPANVSGKLVLPLSKKTDETSDADR